MRQSNSKVFHTTLIAVACLVVSGCAATGSATRDARDPYEAFNRGVYRFNDAIDRGFAAPVTKAYRAVTPKPVRTGVSNFLSNLTYPGTIVNAALQGKVRQAGRDGARFLLNTTFGLGGLLDPATPAGLELNDEDFGQTLGKWGVPSGAYIVLPLLGPSSIRDSFGTVLDRGTDPSNYIDDTATSMGLNFVQLLDRRSRVMDIERQLDGVFDRYAFIRNAWLQRREYQVRDGDVIEAPPDEETEPIDHPSTVETAEPKGPDQTDNEPPPEN
jgi:phospholipid-binding lipoprotein MlaA